MNLYINMNVISFDMHVYPSSGHSSFVFSVAFSPDGTKVVSGSGDSTVKIWNVETGDVLHTLSGEREYDKYLINWKKTS